MDNSAKITGTWEDDPAHFKKVSRRSFLSVGALTGLGGKGLRFAETRSVGTQVDQLGLPLG